MNHDHDQDQYAGTCDVKQYKDECLQCKHLTCIKDARGWNTLFSAIVSLFCKTDYASATEKMEFSISIVEEAVLPCFWSGY